MGSRGVIGRAVLGSRRTRARRWSLPPRPAEQWPGRTAASYGLLVSLAGLAVAAVLVPLHGGGADTTTLVALHAVGAAAGLLCAVLLEVQVAVLVDRRLEGAAGGLLLMAVADVARLGIHVLPGGSLDDSTDDAAHHSVVALGLLWDVSLPLGVLMALLWRRHQALRFVPPLVGVAWCLALVTVPVDGVAVRVSVALAAGLGGAVLIAWQTDRRRLFATHETVSLALFFVALATLLQLVRSGSTTTALTLGPSAEAAVVVGVLVALWLQHLSGYGRQSRRWRHLEQQIGGLRASSALLPGLSITPEDDTGLPEPGQLAELLGLGQAAVAIQAVYDLNTLEVRGQEALARFGGRVPTDHWFRAAGLHGRSIELERLTLAAALRSLSVLPADQFLAVNVSPVSLLDAEVIRMLTAAPLERIVVEITEHDAVGDYAVARTILQRLRDRGARIAVDDVGSGFASLRHVLLLQPDVIKLDARLTRGVDQSPRQLAIVEALVAFADLVGTVVLAEGIEQPEQLAPLSSVGVTLGQGWHLAVPVLVPESVEDGTRTRAS